MISGSMNVGHSFLSSLLWHSWCYEEVTGMLGRSTPTAFGGGREELEHRNFRPDTFFIYLSGSDTYSFFFFCSWKTLGKVDLAYWDHIHSGEQIDKKTIEIGRYYVTFGRELSNNIFLNILVFSSFLYSQCSEIAWNILLQRKCFCTKQNLHF